MVQAAHRSPRRVSTASVERFPFGPFLMSLVGHVLAGFLVIGVVVISSARIDGSRRYVVNLLPPAPHGKGIVRTTGGASPREPAPPVRTAPVPSPPVPSVREGGLAPPSLAQVAPASSRADVARPALQTEAPPPRPPEPPSPLRAPQTPRVAALQSFPASLSAPVPVANVDPSTNPMPPDPATAHSMDTSARLDVTDFPFTYYLRQIQAKISERWAPPTAATGGVGRAIILFEIRRDGQADAPVLEQSSGNALYDESALRAVSEAGPFPPLPAEFKPTSLRVHFGFTSQPDRG